MPPDSYNPQLDISLPNKWLSEVGARSADAHFATYLANHRLRLATSLALTPSAREATSLLELACWGQLLPIFADQLGYQHVAGAGYRTGPEIVRRNLFGRFDYVEVDLETDTYPFADDAFDTVLGWEVIEHLAYDPMHMLAEINRITKPGGLVMITTPNIASARALRSALWGGTPLLFAAYNKKRLLDRHHIEYAPPDIFKLMAAAGFEVTHFSTHDFYSSDHARVLSILKEHEFPTEHRGDTMIVIGKKVTKVQDRYPTPIYE